MTPSPALVELAAKAIAEAEFPGEEWGGWSEDTQDEFRDRAEAVLAAVRPMILEEVKREARRINQAAPGMTGPGRMDNRQAAAWRKGVSSAARDMLDFIRALASPEKLTVTSAEPGEGK